MALRVTKAPSAHAGARPACILPPGEVDAGDSQHLVIDHGAQGHGAIGVVVIDVTECRDFLPAEPAGAARPKDGRSNDQPPSFGFALFSSGGRQHTH